MKSFDDLAAAMAQLNFFPDKTCGGFRRKRDGLWVGESQARAALADALSDISWTEEDVEALSETLAKRLKESNIG